MGPVLFTSNERRTDAPSAIDWLKMPGRGVPSVASRARPRSLAIVTNGCGTKVTIRITTAAIPMSFRGGANRGRAFGGGRRSHPGEKDTESEKGTTLVTRTKSQK